MLLTVNKRPDCPDLLGERVLQTQILQRTNYAMGFAIKTYKLFIDQRKGINKIIYHNKT